MKRRKRDQIDSDSSVQVLRNSRMQTWSEKRDRKLLRSLWWTTWSKDTHIKTHLDTFERTLISACTCQSISFIQFLGNNTQLYIDCFEKNKDGITHAEDCLESSLSTTSVLRSYFFHSDLWSLSVAILPIFLNSSKREIMRNTWIRNSFWIKNRKWVLLSSFLSLLLLIRRLVHFFKELITFSLDSMNSSIVRRIVSIREWKDVSDRISQSNNNNQL